MSYAKILVSGDFLPEDVVVHIESNTRHIDEQLEKKAEEIWQQQLQDAKKEGRNLWDSQEYRLDRVYEKNGVLHLHLSTIRFGIAKAMKEMPEVVEHDPSYYPQGLGIYTVPKTTDGKYVLGENNNKIYKDPPLKVIGGGVVKSEHEVANANDLFLALYRELEEEAGILSDQIKRLVVKAVVRTSVLHVGIAASVELTISSDEVEKQFQQNHDGELSKLLFLEKDEILPYAKKVGEYDPLFEELFASLV